MIIVVVLGLALAVVPLFGGSLTRLSKVELRWPMVAVAAIAIQGMVALIGAIGADTRLLRAVHLASYLAAAVFAWRNRRLPGLWLVAFGGGLNLVAIAANGGVMPATDGALRSAGRVSAVERFSNSAQVTDPRLQILGDIFAIPQRWPLSNVFSIGDLVLACGFAVVVHRAAGSRLSGRAGQRLRQA